MIFNSCQEALNSGARNTWYKKARIEVYVRFTQRRVDLRANTELIRVIDVVNLTSNKPGSGHLRSVFDELEQTAEVNNFNGIFVENVLNPRLGCWLKRRGYEHVFGDYVLPCYWRKIDGTQPARASNHPRGED